jgi:CRP/FNR family transcriptional regulator, cyclic AMP receptor protein
MTNPRGPARSARALLAGAPLLAGLGEPLLDRLAQTAHTRVLAKGQLLFEQGDRADTVYVVGAGRLAMRLAALDGRELVVNEMAPGDVFGELGLLSGGRRSTGAVALEPSEVVGLSQAAFNAALDAEPRLARRLLALTAERLRVSGERESALVFLEAPARLAHVLLELDRAAGPPGAIEASQEGLALRLGLTRQTVAKVLGQWRRAGWLLTGRGKIVLLNRAALRRQALSSGDENSLVSSA